MKLIINQNKEIPELEIMISCPTIDRRVRNLIDYIRQYSASLPGTIENMSFCVPLNTILYIESVDRKVFFYDNRSVYRSNMSLAELETKLENSLFVRISRSCIVNVAHIASTYNCENHRTGVLLSDGERLIAGRTYAKVLHARLNSFHMNMDDTVIDEAQSIPGSRCAVRNYGRILSFCEPPRRLVAITYAVAELLCALGLSERLIGISADPRQIEFVRSEYRDRLRDKPVIQCTDHEPYIPRNKDLEPLAPDLVVSSFYYLNYLEREDTGNLPAPVYILEASVPGKNTLEFFYRDIINLGRIFSAEAKALLLVERLRAEITALPPRPHKRKPPKVFVYDEGRKTPFTTFSDTLENCLITLAGGRNIFSDRSGAYNSVSWTSVANENPDYIVIHRYGSDADMQEKIEWLCQCPEMQECNAVLKSRFIPLTLAEVFPGIQNPSVVRKLRLAFDSEQPES